MPTPSSPQTSDEIEPPTPRKKLPVDSPLHPLSLAAGAGSAAVAAVIGGQLGLSGTVIGAAVGSIVAALTATTIRASVRRSRAAALALARRRRGQADAPASDAAILEDAEQSTEPTPAPSAWSGWARGAVTVGAGFALGIGGLLLLQLGIGRNLSPGTDQLQSAAAKVVASQTPTAHPSATATTTVTQTVSAFPSASPTAAHTGASASLPVPSQSPSGSITPSATPSTGADATP